MGQRPIQGIVAALQAEAQPLVVGRVRAVLCLGVGTVALNIPVDLWLARPRLAALVWLKLSAMLAYGTVALALGPLRPARWDRAVAGATIGIAVICFACEAIGTLTGDALMASYVLAIVALGGAMIFPWGMRGQLALGCLAALGLVVNVEIAPAVWLGSPDLLVAVVSALAASVYAAATLERYQLARKAVELRQAGQKRVLELLARDAMLTEVLEEVLRTTEEQAPEMLCSVLLADEDGRHLRHGAALRLPEEYNRAVDGIAIGPDVGWLGSAAHLRERVVTTDVATDPRWSAFRDLALRHGLQACWSQPILTAEGSVLGAFAMYYRAARGPTPAEVELIEVAAHLAGLAIERGQAREQLGRYVAAVDDAREQAEQAARQLREQAVELAEARDQALASTRTKSEFLANMSHEIRTPMNGIVGMTDILLESPLEADQREFALTIRRCSDALLGVINDILDFSKIEAGKLTVECVDLNLRTVLEEVTTLLAPRAQEKGLEIACVVPADFPEDLKGDPGRLRQVLTNLVGNAIKFTEIGEVVIEARCRYEAPTAATVVLLVRDTGIGIPRDRQQAVFESFTQADGSTTRRYGGTGLGLTICRQLVELMGGQIGLASEPGEGSTFSVELTLPKQAAAAVTPTTRGVLAGVRVLAVDDNATNRTVVCHQLRSWGCRPEEVASGPQALGALHAAVDADPFGLVLLDMHMPEMDGAAVAGRIRADPALAGVPLVLLSSMGALRGGQDAARALGFEAVLTKPVTRAMLLETVTTVLGRHTRTEAVPVSDRRPADGPSLRVLIAEDNSVNRAVLLAMLERLGCRGEAVENGRAAVDAVLRERFDLVLMDVQMPEMDGLEATAEIRRREGGNGPRVPIVALTAHAMGGHRDRCLASGMDDYLTKPVKLDELRQALDRWRAALAAGHTAPAPPVAPAP